MSILTSPPYSPPPYFFKRYAKNLGVYGMTGTMGGDAGKEFMQKHFKVNDKYQ